jgi:hypothetical protein
VFASCQEVDEAPELDQIVFEESTEKGQLEMNLTWTVNDVKDDGMIADLNIYLSSSDWDYTELDESLSAVNISTMDFYGGTRIIPSLRTLKDFNRYFIGVAFNGVLPSATVSYPLSINYSLRLSLGNEVKLIEGEFMIASADQNTITQVEYPWTMDIMENPQEAEYKSYIVRQLEKPIVLSRPADVENTNTFSAEKNLYIEMVWKINGEIRGFERGDLDLYLHDINNTDVENSDDLDFYSLSENSYERITVVPGNTSFTQGVPEKIGFYLFQDMSGTSPMLVEYVYKIYSYENKIKRHTLSGSFTSPPVAEDDGSFYFYADITLNGTTYIVQQLPSVVMWQP